MKKTSLILLLFCFLFSSMRAGENKNDSLNTLIRPFLDSLRIIIPEKDSPDSSTLYLESYFPASRIQTDALDNYTKEGQLYFFVPENKKLDGYVTDPLSIFDMKRIALTYSIADPKFKKILLIKDYKFTSESENIAETDSSEIKMIRQRLYLTFDKNIAVSSAKVGFFEVAFYDRSEQKPIDIGHTVFRYLSFSQDDVNYQYSYLIKDKEGVLTAINFKEGSDRTVPEFKGGRSALSFFLIGNMEYPRKALTMRKEGVVLVSMQIDEYGRVLTASVISSPDPLFNKEAIRLAKLTSGQWISGTNNGKNIKDEKIIPVSFELRYVR